MQINPNKIVDMKILTVCEHSKVSPNGIDCSLAEEILLEPLESKNVLLNEKIELPLDVFATFHTRSSFSRQGVFCTTGVWDSNYSGIVGCTVYNLSKMQIKIEKNTRIGQLVFWQGCSAFGYSGTYKDNPDKESKMKKEN